MTGSDQEVRERLEAIAPATYWRNVFLFAVGKCFVHREHMLDSLVSICADLNEEKAANRILGELSAGRASKAALWGSRLALEVLADGTARQYPEYEVRLARLALQLLKTRDAEASARLAAVYHEDMAELYRESIDDRLGHANFWSKVGAWNLLMSLADRDVDWAVKLAEESWPTDGREQVSLLDSIESVQRGWWTGRVFMAAPKMPPWWLERRSYRWHPAGNVLDTAPKPWKTILRSLFERTRQGLRVINHSSWREGFEEFSLERAHIGPELERALNGLDFEHQGWFPLMAGARFGANPSAPALARELTWLAERWHPEMREALGRIPWPLAACIATASSKEEIERMAEKAHAGGFGDTSDWVAAETRWEKQGVVEEDVSHLRDDRWPFDAGIRVQGFPLSAADSVMSRAPDFKRTEDIVCRLHSVTGRNARTWLARLLLSRLLPGYYAEQSRLQSPRTYRDLYEFATGTGTAPSLPLVGFLNLLARSFHRKKLDSEWIGFLDLVGRGPHFIRIEHENSAFVDQLVHHFCSDPEGKKGLLPFIAAGAASGRRLVLPREVLETARGWSDRARQDADVLALAVEDLTEKEIGELARRLGAEGAIWRALTVSSGVSTDREIAFALAVIDNVTPDSDPRSYATAAAHRALVQHLTGRPSKFDSSRLCSDLTEPTCRKPTYRL